MLTIPMGSQKPVNAVRHQAARLFHRQSVWLILAVSHQVPCAVHHRACAYVLRQNSLSSDHGSSVEIGTYVHCLSLQRISARCNAQKKFSFLIEWIKFLRAGERPRVRQHRALTWHWLRSVLMDGIGVLRQDNLPVTGCHPRHKITFMFRGSLRLPISKKTFQPSQLCLHPWGSMLL